MVRVKHGQFFILRRAIIYTHLIDRTNFSVYIYCMKIEWDQSKREATLRERGLDFATVAEADWDNALTVEDTRADYAERRFVSLLPIHSRLCVLAWCRRGDALRVISLRKANSRERKRYEQT